MHRIELETDHVSYVRCTCNQILDYKSNLAITRDELSGELDKIPCDIKDVRYIYLKKLFAINNDR